jgi:hypothetical protein
VPIVCLAVFRNLNQGKVAGPRNLIEEFYANGTLLLSAVCGILLKQFRSGPIQNAGCRISFDFSRFDIGMPPPSELSDVYIMNAASGTDKNRESKDLLGRA